MAAKILKNDSISVDEFRNTYLWGIQIIDSQGDPMPDELIISYLNSAVTQLEGLLDICLSERNIEAERHDYYRSDYMNWGYLQLWKRPINEVFSLKMKYGSGSFLSIPESWIKINSISGQIQLFPDSGSASSIIIGNTGLIYGMQGLWQSAPQLWEVSYNAGFKGGEIPDAMLEYIYKLAAISVLSIWGDLWLGAGIASSSLAIDGLSQSIGTSRSGSTSPASARISQYQADLDRLMNILRMEYQGVKMVVV